MNTNPYRLGGIATFLSIALISADTVITGVVSPANVPLSSRLLNSAAYSWANSHSDALCPLRHSS